MDLLNQNEFNALPEDKQKEYIEKYVTGIYKDMEGKNPKEDSWKRLSVNPIPPGML